MCPHSCLICLGSNHDRKSRMHAAREALSEAFPDIRFGEEMETEALGEGFLSPFSNQLATFRTSLDADGVRRLLKEIEKANGRLPEDKSRGIVKMDIDILIHDKQVLKPDDLKRDYIRRGIDFLLG